MARVFTYIISPLPMANGLIESNETVCIKEIMMKKIIFISGCLCLLLTLLAPAAFGQSTISAVRRTARKELGQLNIEYNRDAFVKQASEGDTIAVELFLDAGMQLEGYDKNGQTVLIAAAANGQVETVQLLLDRGANIDALNSVNGSQHSALYTAVRENRFDVVKLLLSRGVDVKKGVNIYALQAAAARGSTDVAQVLLSKGADVNVMAYEETPLQAAVRRQHVDMVKLLLNNKAEVNAQDREGYTALHMATWGINPNIEIIKTLLDNGADVNLKNKHGQTALQLVPGERRFEPESAEDKRRSEIVDLLTKAGVKP